MVRGGKVKKSYRAADQDVAKGSEEYYLEQEGEAFIDFQDIEFDIAHLDLVKAGANEWEQDDSTEDLEYTEAEKKTLNKPFRLKDGKKKEWGICKKSKDCQCDYGKVFIQFGKHVGWISSCQGELNAWRYAGIDEDGFITEVVEKKQVSDYATAGYYYWSKGSDVVKYAEQMIEDNSRTNGEFYVAPVYNWAVLDGKRIGVFMVDKCYSLGTPEDLKEYLNG